MLGMGITVADSALINNDVAHHASLGGNHSLAASASLLAAEECLRVFTYVCGSIGIGTMGHSALPTFPPVIQTDTFGSPA